MKNINTAPAQAVSTTCTRQQGLSLVELMIAMTIGVILVIGVTRLIVQQSNTRDELEKSSRQIENGRYAMHLLHEDIEHAGYYGQFYSLTSLTLPGTLPDPCLTSPVTSLEAALRLPIQGYDYTPSSPLVSKSFSDASISSPLSCINAKNLMAGSDILVIRRLASTVTPTTGSPSIGTNDPGLVYMQTIPGQEHMDTGGNVANFTLSITTASGTTPGNIRQYYVHIYYISPCYQMANGSTCQSTDDNGHPIPTLKRLDLSASGGNTTISTVTPLAEGIENMQIDYGIDNSPAPNGDGYPDNNYSTVPANTTDWANVVTLRIHLLARNIDCSTGYADTKTYDLGTKTASAPAATCTNGDYKRHIFTEVVQAINQVGRRAIQ